MAAPDDLEIAVVVLHAHRHVIARLQPGRPQEAAEAVRRRVELGEGLGEAGPGHDDRGLVAVFFEIRTGEHAEAR